MLNAATASMKRNYGLVVGLAWPAALGVIGLANLPPGQPLRDGARAVFGVISYIDPLKYMNAAVISYPQLVMLVVLALIYGTLAALQWQRVEA